MKILVYGINFAPEPTGIGRYSGEMAFWLADAGHEVRVITAPPYYPQWRIGEGYRGWRHARERWQGVRVWRTPLWVPSIPTGAKRLVHLASFAVFSIPALLRHVFWKPDVVCVIAPAFVCTPAGWIAARICGAAAWLHVQDFEVDAAFRLGLLKGAWARRLASAFERAMLGRFDRVSTISGRMVDLLKDKGVGGERAVFFPNWVDVGMITPLQGPSPYRAELGIPDGAVVALYSGSLAAKQGLELIPAAARELERILPGLVFVICGEGVNRKMIERECAGLGNVRLLPLQPAGRLRELLGLADVHLLPQQADAADLVMPSKLTGMLSSGRPILATANPGSELARVVAARGRVVPQDDLPSFVAALMTLAGDAELRRRLGFAARQYAEEHLARDGVLAAFEQALTGCAGRRRAAGESSGGTLPKTKVVDS